MESGTPLRIAEGLDVVVISNNEVLVQFGSRSHPSQLFRDTDLTGILGQVIGRLQAAPATRAEAAAWVPPEHRAEAYELIDRLCAQGILVDAAKSAVDQYLGFVYTGETRLADRRIGLIGAGPLGAQTAETLLRHGVGRIQLLDGRETDAVWRAAVPSNGGGNGRNGTPAQVGLRDQLLGMGYSGVTATESNLDDRALDGAVAGSDLLIVALEQPDVRLAHRVNRRCLAAGRRWLHAVIDGSLGVVGPLFVPGVTACYNDFRSFADAANPSPLMSRVYRQHAARRGAASFAPGLPAHAAIAGGFVSLAAVHTLLTGTSFALGRVLSINFDRMLIDVEDVLKLPRCPACGQLRSAYQPAFSAEVVTRVTAHTPPAPDGAGTAGR